MRRLVPLVISPWALPLVVLGLVAPSMAAFALVGPQLGLAVGALTATAVIVLAARAGYDEPIEIAASRDRRYRLLVVAPEPLERPDTVEAIAGVVEDGSRAIGADPGSEPEVLVVVPAAETSLARWLSDVGPARTEARRALAVSLGTLTAAGLAAAGHVGDGDAVQAVEDALRTYAAQEVVVVTGGGIGAGEVEELRRRLDRPITELDRG